MRRATGLALTDKALARLIGNGGKPAPARRWHHGGLFTFETLEVKSPTIIGQFAGRAGSSEIQGRLGIDAPDLAKFGDVAGLGLRGSAKLSAEVEGTPRANRFNVKVDGHASQFATGIAAVDGLFGGRLEFEAACGWSRTAASALTVCASRAHTHRGRSPGRQHRSGPMWRSPHHTDPRAG